MNQCRSDKQNEFESHRQELSAVQQLGKNLDQSLKILQISLDSYQDRVKTIQSKWINSIHQWNDPNQIQQKLRVSLADSRMNLWHENFVNGEYVIAYKFQPLLDSWIKSMLSKVRP